MPPRHQPARALPTKLLLLTAALTAALTLSACEPLGFAPEVLACDIVADTGCAEGQTCVDLNSPKCVPAGEAALGDTCAKDEDCAAKHLCVAAPDGSKFCLRRCDLTAASPCKALGEAENNAKLKASSCLWASLNGDRNLGYCSSPQCVPASDEGCKKDQRCIGGIEPHCQTVGATTKVTLAGKTVSYPVGEIALGEACLGPGHCVSGGVCAAVSGAVGDAQRCLTACTLPAKDQTGASAGSGRCESDFICKALRIEPAGGGDPQDLPAGQGFCAREHCNLVSNAGCQAGQKCIATASGVPGCTVAGGVGLLGKCDELSDCDAATTCVSGGQRTLCVKKCDTSGELPGLTCPADQKCAALKDAQGQPKPNNLGFCVPK